MKVLLSAYACTPGAGSEPGVGFATLMAAAQEHEVWILTRSKNVIPIQRSLKGNVLASRIHVVGFDLPGWQMMLKKKLGLVGLQWYYDRWQLEAARRASTLMHSVEFDVAHHVTFSSEWSRPGIAQLGLPFVWGPLGGGVTAPAQLLTTLGWRGIASEAARMVGRSVMRRRRSQVRAWQKAGVVLVQNSETAERSLDSSKTLVLPHSTALLSQPPQGEAERSKDVLVVGRLIPWKGGALALRAFSKVRNTQATLHFIGQGPDLTRLRRIATKLGVLDRVTFVGAISRDAVLERIARAGVLLHPALHDDSPIVVGEALSLGTPVVCLNRGGPPELLKRWRTPGTAVKVGSPLRTAERLARAVEGYLAEELEVASQAVRAVPSYTDSILTAYREAIVGGSAARN